MTTHVEKMFTTLGTYKFSSYLVLCLFYLLTKSKLAYFIISRSRGLYISSCKLSSTYLWVKTLFNDILFCFNM